MNDVIAISILGLVAGVMSGMFGIGGGIVIVQMLVILGFSLTSAFGTSLAALMMPVGIFAVISYYKEGYVNLKAALTIAVGLLCGVKFGAMLALYIDQQLLKQIYGVFLLWVCWRFFDVGSILKNRGKKPTDTKPKEEVQVTFFKMLPMALLAGLLSGMFGIGGGLVIVPLLVTFWHFDSRRAVGTSLTALLPPVALPGVLEYYNSGNLDLVAAAILAVGLLVGSLFGAKFSLAMSATLAKRCYSVFILAMAAYFIITGF